MSFFDHLCKWLFTLSTDFSTGLHRLISTGTLNISHISENSELYGIYEYFILYGIPYIYPSFLFFPNDSKNVQELKPFPAHCII